MHGHWYFALKYWYFWSQLRFLFSGVPHCLVITHIDKASDPRSNEEQALVDEIVKHLQLSAGKPFYVHEVSNYNESDPIE